MNNSAVIWALGRPTWATWVDVKLELLSHWPALGT